MTARVSVQFRGCQLWATTEGYLTAQADHAGEFAERADAERVALAVQDHARGAHVEVVADTTPEPPATDESLQHTTDRPGGDA